MTTMTDRHELRFAEAVEDQFGFLQEHGFRRVQREPSFVRFESKHVYVNVYHGRQSFEIGLEVGSLVAGAEETSYSMSEIIRLVEPGKADGYRNYAARSPNGVAEGVQGLAMLFRRYVDAGVLDGSGLFERLRKGRKTWSREYAKEVNLTHARQKLGVAWHAKDYTQVVELLRPLRDALTPTELHKLEYAEKHAGRS
jgi:hypothetical protein